MKKVCIITFVLLCLAACHNKENHNISYVTVKCEKNGVVEMIEDSEWLVSYKMGFVVMDDILKRKIYVKEIFLDNFDEISEYEIYFARLQDGYLSRIMTEEENSVLMPYYEDDRIIYPYLVYDYTDLSNYTDNEVPMSVRTRDGKAIVFDLYWRHIEENGLLDGFRCTLLKEE